MQQGLQVYCNSQSQIVSLGAPTVSFASLYKNLVVCRRLLLSTCQVDDSAGELWVGGQKMLRWEVSCLAGLFGEAALVPAAVGFAEPLCFCTPDSDLADSCQNLCTLHSAWLRQRRGLVTVAMVMHFFQATPPSVPAGARRQTASGDGTLHFLPGELPSFLPFQL